MGRSSSEQSGVGMGRVGGGPPAAASSASVRVCAIMRSPCGGGTRVFVTNNLPGGTPSGWAGAEGLPAPPCRRSAGSSKSPAPAPRAVSPHAVTRPAVAPTSAQLSVLVRRIADLEAKNARVEADRAADAEQMGGWSRRPPTPRPVRACSKRASRRSAGVAPTCTVGCSARRSLPSREGLSPGAGDAVVDETNQLLRTTLATIETLHDHADAVEQLAESPRVSAQKHNEAIVARTFAAVAARAHATQAEIETVDGLLAGVTEQARSVRKLQASLDDARATLIARSGRSSPRCARCGR